MEIINDQPTQPTFEHKKPRKRYPTAGDLWAIIGIYFVATIAGAGLSMIVPGIDKGLSMFCSYVLGFGVTLVYALNQRREKMVKGAKLLYFQLKGVNASLIAYAVVLLIAVGIAIEPLINLFPQSMLEQLNAIIGRGFWPVMTAVVAAPILEELLFRGVILQGIMERSGAVKAVLISSAIFGVIHIIPPQAINAFFAALVLGFIYVRSGSLTTVIIIHAINNAVSYVIAGGDDPFKTTRQMIGNDTLYYIVYGFTLAVMCYLFWRVYDELRKIDAAKAEAKAEAETEKN